MYPEEIPEEHVYMNRCTSCVIVTFTVGVLSMALYYLTI